MGICLKLKLLAPSPPQEDQHNSQDSSPNRSTNGVNMQQPRDENDDDKGLTLSFLPPPLGVGAGRSANGSGVGSLPPTMLLSGPMHLPSSIRLGPSYAQQQQLQQQQQLHNHNGEGGVAGGSGAGGWCSSQQQLVDEEPLRTIEVSRCVLGGLLWTLLLTLMLQQMC